jgi:glycosyltransferase 2 family protein
LKRKYNAPYKQTSAAVLLDRFSGLVALGLIMSVYGIVVIDNTLYDAILTCGSVAAVIVLYLVIRFYFTDFLPGFWATFFWGIIVQITQVICIYCILLSLRLPTNQPQWVFVFLIAAVVAVFPISLGGGLGTRELVFVEGAKYFHLDAQIALVISLLFYLSTVIASIWGVFFVFYDPLKEED